GSVEVSPQRHGSTENKSWTTKELLSFGRSVRAEALTYQLAHARKSLNFFSTTRCCGFDNHQPQRLDIFPANFFVYQILRFFLSPTTIFGFFFCAPVVYK